MLKSSLTAFNSSKLFSSKRKNSTFWSWATQPRGNWKESLQEAAVAICVFGVTGTASVSLVRPALKNIGLEGSMIDGPNSYRIFSVIIVSPIYACLLLISVCHKHFSLLICREINF